MPANRSTTRAWSLSGGLPTIPFCLPDGTTYAQPAKRTDLAINGGNGGVPWIADLERQRHLLVQVRRHRHHRRVQQLALLLCNRAEVLMQIVSPIASGGCLSMQDERGDGISDGVVEQAVKGSKFAQGYGRVHLDRQLGDDLANVTVTMDYLIYGVSLLE